MNDSSESSMLGRVCWIEYVGCASKSRIMRACKASPPHRVALQFSRRGAVCRRGGWLLRGRRSPGADAVVPGEQHGAMRSAATEGIKSSSQSQRVQPLKAATSAAKVSESSSCLRPSDTHIGACEQAGSSVGYTCSTQLARSAPTSGRGLLTGSAHVAWPWRPAGNPCTDAMKTHKHQSELARTTA